jgi:hypothetical protein
MWSMKTFRGVLTVGGAVFVEADRYESSDGFIPFYRADSMIAEYPAGSVTQDIEEKTLTQRYHRSLRGPRAASWSLHRGQKPTTLWNP